MIFSRDFRGFNGIFSGKERNGEKPTGGCWDKFSRKRADARCHRQPPLPAVDKVLPAMSHKQEKAPPGKGSWRGSA